MTTHYKDSGAVKRFVCVLLGHKWDRDWRTIDTNSVWFQRVDCTRCGLAIDGVALKRISDVLRDD